mgnify:CR=1 FL=1
MDLKPVTYGAITGALLVTGVLAGLKVRDLLRAKAQAESERPTGALAPAVAELRERLTTFTETKTQEIAGQTADQLMAADAAARGRVGRFGRGAARSGV